MQTVSAHRQAPQPTRQLSVAINGKNPLQPQVADRLLELLSTDNMFRDLFEKDPNAALAMLGHPISTESISRCGPVNRIASKNEFISARDHLKAHITSAGIFTNPHCFEAGSITAALRRK
ncbi:NHLP-related RiPP peptide [Lysobacter koreensis]|uniref:NHLP-related RiPP peptide n=1 Tax=Lysobacter koreensis TaxID=266122 RepID=A0ABW2YPP2_9GAMM